MSDLSRRGSGSCSIQPSTGPRVAHIEQLPIGQAQQRRRDRAKAEVLDKLIVARRAITADIGKEVQEVRQGARDRVRQGSLDLG